MNNNSNIVAHNNINLNTSLKGNSNNHNKMIIHSNNINMIRELVEVVHKHINLSIKLRDRRNINRISTTRVTIKEETNDIKVVNHPIKTLTIMRLRVMTTNSIMITEMTTIVEVVAKTLVMVVSSKMTTTKTLMTITWRNMVEVVRVTVVLVHLEMTTMMNLTMEVRKMIKTLMITMMRLIHKSQEQPVPHLLLTQEPL